MFYLINIDDKEIEFHLNSLSNLAQESLAKLDKDSCT